MSRTASKLKKILIGILVGVLALTLMEGTAQASWEDKGSTSNYGSGGAVVGGGGSNGDFSCGQNFGKTPGALYRKVSGSWYRWFEYGYPNCVSPTMARQEAWSRNHQFTVNPAGFLVYRFYGTPKNPTAAVTRSNLNLTGWGRYESVYAFHGANPLDAGTTKVGSPWVHQRGINYDLVRNGAKKSQSQYFRNDAGLLVPSTPTLVKGKCTNLETGQKIRDWYKNTASEHEKIALRAALGYDYWQASGGGKYTATGLAEAGLREAKGYRFKWSEWKKDTSRAPKRDNKGDAFYLTDFKWETRACASPFQFAGQESQHINDRPIVGTCYIEVRRRSNLLKGVSTGRQVTVWESLYGVNGGGERFSTIYRNKKFTPGGSGGDSNDRNITGLSAAAQKKLIGSWRDFMVSDYRKQYKNNGNRFIDTRTGRQLLPANPYPSDAGSGKISAIPTINKSQAETALRNYSRCRVTTAIRFDMPDKTTVKKVSPKVNLAIKNQEVFQVTPTQATVTVRPQAMTCNGKSCGADVKLDKLNWTTAVTGINGYNMCKASNISNAIPNSCSGIYTVKTTNNGKHNMRQDIHFRFAEATNPKEAVRVSLTKLSGQYTQTTSTKGLVIRGINPITGKYYNVDTGSLTNKYTGSVGVSATASPAKLAKTSQGFTFQLPVIGAVQIPVK